jgi:hypothetical protein
MIFLFAPGGVEQAFLDHALEARAKRPEYLNHHGWRWNR